MIKKSVIYQISISRSFKFLLLSDETEKKFTEIIHEK